VEDDRVLGGAMAAAFSRGNDIGVDWRHDVAEARLALVDHHYSIVILDLGLPDGSGLHVLQAMRAGCDTTPVLIVTEQGRLSERVRGLDSGADDYMVKPFDFDELLARMRALLRRSSNSMAPAMRHGDVALFPGRRIVTRAGKPVALSRHEYRTLLALMERKGRVVTRDFLDAVLYGDAVAVESNTVAVYVHQLRRKLGRALIDTIHGVGYRVGDGASSRGDGGREHSRW
jgi:two-component system OmpR family response regulator